MRDKNSHQYNKKKTTKRKQSKQGKSPGDP